MKYSSMGNLRDNRGKFTSRKQLANGQSISCSCLLFFFIMTDTRVHSDWAKTVNVTFVSEIINSKSVSKTTFTRVGFIWVNVETDKNLSLFVCCVWM